MFIDSLKIQRFIESWFLKSSWEFLICNIIKISWEDFLIPKISWEDLIFYWFLISSCLIFLYNVTNIQSKLVEILE